MCSAIAITCVVVTVDARLYRTMYSYHFSIVQITLSRSLFYFFYWSVLARVISAPRPITRLTGFSLSSVGNVWCAETTPAHREIMSRRKEGKGKTNLLSAHTIDFSLFIASICFATASATRCSSSLLAQTQAIYAYVKSLPVSIWVGWKSIRKRINGNGCLQ